MRHGLYRTHFATSHPPATQGHEPQTQSSKFTRRASSPGTIRRTSTFGDFFLQPKCASYMLRLLNDPTQAEGDLRPISALPSSPTPDRLQPSRSGILRWQLLASPRRSDDGFLTLGANSTLVCAAPTRHEPESASMPPAGKNLAYRRRSTKLRHAASSVARRHHPHKLCPALRVPNRRSAHRRAHRAAILVAQAHEHRMVSTEMAIRSPARPSSPAPARRPMRWRAPPNRSHVRAPIAGLELGRDEGDLLLLVDPNSLTSCAASKSRRRPDRRRSPPRRPTRRSGGPTAHIDTGLRTDFRPACFQRATALAKLRRPWCSLGHARS